MAKKIINTYQVSFAKSLDISKDYKSSFKPKAKQLKSLSKLKINISEFFEDEELLSSLLAPLNLNAQVIVSEVYLKLDDYKHLKVDVNIIIKNYTDGSTEILTVMPPLSDLIRYYFNFDVGRRAYPSFFKKTRNKLSVKSYEKNNLDYNVIITCVKLKLLLDQSGVKNSFLGNMNSVMGSLSSFNFG